MQGLLVEFDFSANQRVFCSVPVLARWLQKFAVRQRSVRLRIMSGVGFYGFFGARFSLGGISTAVIDRRYKFGGGELCGEMLRDRACGPLGD
jgi:hypothetical protein